MLKSEDKLTLELHGTLSSDGFSSLQMLYAPLLGKDALVLYQTLAALAAQPQKIRNHLLVQKISGLSMERMEVCREVLEQYLLVKTYYDGARNAYIYSIYMPKEGNDFLRHDVFGRLYMKKMGKQVYEFARTNFAPTNQDKSKYQEITTSMRNLMDWDDQAEDAFRDLRPEQKPMQALPFNFDVFLSGLSNMIFPESQRTAENLQFIAEKASLYGISEKDMQVLVGKSINIRTNTLDRNKLVKFMQKAKKNYDKTFDDPYQMPPVRFLQSKQHGVHVSVADQRLIDDVLQGQYHLVPEVINVLLEYVLERCNQVLSKAYVEKVAATWVRLGIDTVQKAQDAIQNETKEKKSYVVSNDKQLPAWFHDQDSVKPQETNFDKEALKEKMRKLRENNG